MRGNKFMKKDEPSFTTRILLTLALAATMCGMAKAQTPNETVLHQFGATPADGGYSYGGLARGVDGVLYGATWAGGTNGCGTVFRINPDGSGFAVLHSFAWSPDGADPYGTLTQASDGALYGTTQFGGTNNNGSVFKISTNGTAYQDLYSFTNTPDGATPYGGLVQGGDGALYGTTAWGGTNNAGTVFKINTDGSGYTVLHSFTNTSFDGPPLDGGNPYTGLMLGMDGALYGVTSQGGTNLLGTVFRINTNGTGYAVLHHFSGYSDGMSPQAALTQGSDGTLYGTTIVGGTNGCGTLFKLSANGGGFAVLHAFPISSDGAYPHGGLLLASDGALYGTTMSGGQTSAGTVFKVNTDGSGYSVLYNFTRTNGDGAQSWASLTEANAGMFYGTTLNGGTNGFGTLFRLAMSPNLNAVFSKPTGLQVTVTGFSSQPCQIQATTNFIDWVACTNLVLTNGIGQFTDSATTNAWWRFYRAVVQ